jgi:hypothetical protein
MAPLIRFSEKSLRHPKHRVAAHLGGGLRTPTVGEGSTRAHTVCNFGIRAADAGMVPTKTFFCTSLKGRTTPRRGRGGTDCGLGQRRPAGDGPTANGSQDAQKRKLAEDRDGVWHSAGEAVVAQLAAQFDRANARSTPTRRPANREAWHGKYSFVSFVSESTPVGKGPVNKFESAALQQHRVTATQPKLDQANESKAYKENSAVKALAPAGMSPLKRLALMCLHAHEDPSRWLGTGRGNAGMRTAARASSSRECRSGRARRRRCHPGTCDVVDAADARLTSAGGRTERSSQ